jgi:exopolysaccharide production protein ExoZ
MVAWFHAIELQVNAAPSFHQNIPRLLDVLSSGVDIFFVLSGFIISHSANRYSGGRQALNFLRRRFVRINPVYYVALLLYLAIRWHWMVNNHRIPGTAAILRSIILLPPDSPNSWPILPVAWTLCFEWLFYLLFAVAIAARVRNRALLLPALGVILFIINPIMLEFMLGMLIYRWYSYRPPTTAIAAGLALAGILLFVSQCCWGNLSVAAPIDVVNGSISLERCIFRGIPAALLLSGCVFLEKKNVLSPLWNNKAAKGLGDSSYSIYLTHVTVYMICGGIMARLGPVISPDLSVIVWLFLGITAGILFYRTVETSLLKAFR